MEAIDEKKKKVLEKYGYGGNPTVVKVIDLKEEKGKVVYGENALTLE